MQLYQNIYVICIRYKQESSCSSFISVCGEAESIKSLYVGLIFHVASVSLLLIVYFTLVTPLCSSNDLLYHLFSLFALRVSRFFTIILLLSPSLVPRSASPLYFLH